MCWVLIMLNTGKAWKHRFHNQETMTMGNKKSKFAALFQEYPDGVSVPQLCKMLGVCKGNAYQLLHSGQIKYLRVGQVYRIPKLLCHWFSGKGNTGSKVGYGPVLKKSLKGVVKCDTLWKGPCYDSFFPYVCQHWFLLKCAAVPIPIVHTKISHAGWRGIFLCDAYNIDINTDVLPAFHICYVKHTKKSTLRYKESLTKWL